MDEEFIPSLLWKDNDDEEETEEPTDLLSQLENFRQQWKDELQKKHNDTRDWNGNASQTPSREEEAKFLFCKGIKLEQSGHLYEAIKFYREATHLVEDIEFKCNMIGTSPRVRQESESSVGSIEQDEILDDDLVAHFQKLNVNESQICQQKHVKNTTHISVLPVELLIYIFKWVVSSDLDVKQLEILSQVSRGFYLCARDDGIWKKICQRTWGSNTGKLRKYFSWRTMFINRPHILFNGCYISKMSYVRAGEQSLDGFYKPFHLVEYYRYIRCFPDGLMMMISSADDPFAVLSRLQSRNSKEPGMLKGIYRVNGDMVTGMLKRVKEKERSKSHFRSKRRPAPPDPNEMEQTFHLELEIQNHKERSHAKLKWIHYSVVTRYVATGNQNEAEFELNKSFPPLVFSRVRSYSSYSEAPLQ